MNQRISDETRARVAAIWQDFLTDVASGALIRDVLKKHNLTDGIKRAYLAGNAEARQQWEEAREASADSMYDEALALARPDERALLNDAGEPILGKDGEPLIIRPDPALVRAQADILKWATRIRNPKAYSDKQSIDLNVRTIDVTQTLIAAQARLEASRALLPAIMGQAVRVDDQGGGGTDS